MGSGGMSMEDFLNDRRERSGDWLAMWKKEGTIVVWLHTKARIHPRHVHQFHYVEAREDKETRKITKVLRTLRFGCWEEKGVIFSRTDRDTGLLQVQPKVCPLHRLQQALVALPESRLKDDAEVFVMRGRNWEGSEPAEARYVKGHLTGTYKRTSTSWKTTLFVKNSYLFTVVPNDDVDGGPKITDESQMLADAVRAVIVQQRDSKGDEEGDPTLNPYAFKWVYDEKAAPKDKYKAYAYEKAKLTDEIRYQIVDAEPPDLAPFCVRGDAVLLRSYVEEYLTPEAKKVLDLDDIFGPAEALQAKEEEGKDAEPRRPRGHKEAPPEREDDPSRPVQSRRRKKEEPAVPPLGEPCEDCGADMRVGQAKCGKCGAEYEIDDAPAASSPSSSSGSDDSDGDPFSDEIPF